MFVDDEKILEVNNEYLLWVAHMNGLKAQAEEVMVREIVYAE